MDFIQIESLSLFSDKDPGLYGPYIQLVQGSGERVTPHERQGMVLYLGKPIW